MDNYWFSIITGIVLLILAIPYVDKIRHSQQKFLAAYLIFVSVFILASALIFNLLVRLAHQFSLSDALEEPWPIALFLLIVFLPAFIVATWLARKPRWKQGPPS
jgi:hypothetical protein